MEEMASDTALNTMEKTADVAMRKGGLKALKDVSKSAKGGAISAVKALMIDSLAYMFSDSKSCRLFNDYTATREAQGAQTGKDIATIMVGLAGGSVCDGGSMGEQYMPFSRTQVSYAGTHETSGSGAGKTKKNNHPWCTVKFAVGQKRENKFHPCQYINIITRKIGEAHDMFFTDIDPDNKTLNRPPQAGFNACRKACLDYTPKDGDLTMEGTAPTTCKFFIYDESDGDKVCILADRTWWGWGYDSTIDTTTNFWNNSRFDGNHPSYEFVDSFGSRECQRPDGTKLRYDEAPYTTDERLAYAKKQGTAAPSTLLNLVRLEAPSEDSKLPDAQKLNQDSQGLIGDAMLSAISARKKEMKDVAEQNKKFQSTVIVGKNADGTPKKVTKRVKAPKKFKLKGFLKSGGISMIKNMAKWTDPGNACNFFNDATDEDVAANSTTGEKEAYTLSSFVKGMFVNDDPCREESGNRARKMFPFTKKDIYYAVKKEATTDTGEMGQNIYEALQSQPERSDPARERHTCHWVAAPYNSVDVESKEECIKACADDSWSCSFAIYKHDTDSDLHLCLLANRTDFGYKNSSIWQCKPNERRSYRLASWSCQSQQGRPNQWKTAPVPQQCVAGVKWCYSWGVPYPCGLNYRSCSPEETRYYDLVEPMDQKYIDSLPGYR